MTVCVPRKPFEIFGLALAYFLVFSWTITLPIGVMNMMKITNIGDTYIEFLCGAMSLLCCIIIIRDENEKRHWIQWCENKPTDKTSKEDRKE